MLNIEQRNRFLTWIIEQIKAGEVALPLEARQFNADDWAFILEAIPAEIRPMLWQGLALELQNQILSALRDDAKNQLISQLSKQDIENILQIGSNEQQINVIDALPDRVAHKLIKKLSQETCDNLTSALGYGTDQLGRYVNHDVYTLDIKTDVASVLEELKNTDLPAYTDSLLVVDQQGKYCGELELNTLFSAEHEQNTAQLLASEQSVLLAHSSLLDASNHVKNSGRSMVPVVTEGGLLLGRFSLKDALDVFQEQYETQLLHMGQVNDEDLFAPVIISARRRAVWLGFNLLTAFLASSVISLFDQVVSQVVALAVLLPIVASMGGITGSQTLTLTIRGLATGQLSAANVGMLKSKELHIAFYNGILWALVVAGITFAWFDSLLIAAILAFALIVNMLVAAFCGISIPVLLKKLNIDPALAGSVILTTVTDVIGFFVFLGLASLVFL